MKLKVLLLSGFLFSTVLILAQTNFQPGYVIKTNGDTVFGKIDYRGDLLMSEICKFKLNDNADEIVYSPGDIAAYRFINDKYFISKEVKGKKIFLEFLIKGQVSVFYMRDDNGDHFFIEKTGLGLAEIPYKESIKYKDNESYYFKSTTHIGILNLYMQDAPKLQGRIAEFGIPNHNSLIRLAEDYHNMVCKDESCIIYEKKVPFLKLNLEILGGIVNYMDLEDYNGINDQKYFQSGILTNFWVPRASENLYFRTGIIYSTIKGEDSKGPLFKVPLQLEYTYPKGIINPKFAYGINLYFYDRSITFMGQSVAFMGGMNIKLYKSLYLSIDYDIDFVPDSKFPLLPESLYSQSILTGLLIKI